jgi:hypothetical protein
VCEGERERERKERRKKGKEYQSTDPFSLLKGNSTERIRKTLDDPNVLHRGESDCAIQKREKEKEREKERERKRDPPLSLSLSAQRKDIRTETKAASKGNDTLSTLRSSQTIERLRNNVIINKAQTHRQTLSSLSRNSSCSITLSLSLSLSLSSSQRPA